MALNNGIQERMRDTSRDFRESNGSSGDSEALFLRSRLADMVSEITERAVRSLWSYYNRPAGDGTTWAQSAGFPSLASFARSLAADPAQLAGQCRAANADRKSTPEEKEAFAAILDIYDGLGNALVHLVRGSLPFSIEQTIQRSSAMEEHRSEDRSRSEYHTRFRSEGLQYIVRVKNISPGGAMVQGLSVAIGANVSVELQDIGWVKGVVRWSLADRCGIAFIEELPGSAVAAD